MMKRGVEDVVVPGGKEPENTALAERAPIVRAVDVLREISMRWRGEVADPAHVDGALLCRTLRAAFHPHSSPAEECPKTAQRMYQPCDCVLVVVSTTDPTQVLVAKRRMVLARAS